MNLSMQKALEVKKYATNIRRFIHENPEISFKEYSTTDFIKKELSNMGIEILPNELETGVVAIINGEKNNNKKVTAIRADIDALPILENTKKQYKSKNDGVMHACGHDGHTAVLLGVAKVLNSIKKEFSGIVKLVFQPAEEGLYGALKVIESGALDNPKPDNIVALHGWPLIPTGDIGTWKGQYMASADMFEIRVKGIGGHGARPHMAVNPIVASSQIVMAIQNIVASEIPFDENTIVTVCKFNSGSAFNVIPEEVVFGGTVRCLNEKNRVDVKNRIERIVKGVCESMNCTYEYNYTFGVPSLFNSEEIVENIEKAAKICLGEGHIQSLGGPTMGSEDFSNLINYIGKGAFFRLGLTNAGDEPLSFHNDKFDFNDDAIPTGIAVLVQYVLEINC